MAIGVLDSDLPTTETALPAASTASEVPQFDHAIGPWIQVGIAAVITLMLVVLFMYGQAAPGA